jgi:hypothetical protein
MEILSRVQQVFNVSLSPRVLYAGEFTVAGLTKAILTEQIRQATPSDVSDNMQMLDAMSEEEARALLGAKAR